MKTIYPLTQIGFIAVTIVYVGLLIFFVHKALAKSSFTPQRRTRIFFGIIAAIVVWLLFISILAYQQVLSDFSTLPPKFFIVLIIPLVTLLIVTSTDAAREILRHIPAQNIIYLQTFRVFVEILLWTLFIENLLPVQMTFEGYNFDILAGLTAPIAGLLVARTQSVALMRIWNIACLCLLINIVSIAIVSTPVPFRVFMNEPANTIVTQFPIVWLPGILVPLAYTLHILSLRQASMLAKVHATA